MTGSEQRKINDLDDKSLRNEKISNEAGERKKGIDNLRLKRNKVLLFFITLCLSFDDVRDVHHCEKDDKDGLLHTQTITLERDKQPSFQFYIKQTVCQIYSFICQHQRLSNIKTYRNVM